MINNKAMRIVVVIKVFKVIKIIKDLFCEEPVFDIHHKKKTHFAFFCFREMEKFEETERGLLMESSLK